MTNVEQNKAKFLEYLNQYCSQREGIDKIVAMLNRTDFFVAPASRKYHLAVEGGTCIHSLNVLYNLLGFVAIDSGRPEVFNIVNKFCNEVTLVEDEKVELEKTITDFFGPKVNLCSLVITALLHDCHKINFYEKVEKSVYKGVDGSGRKIFETEQQYQMREDRLVFGDSGTNSNYIITSYMRLTFEEMLAIENHHGVDINGNQQPASATAWTKSRLALYLHLADMKAAFTEEQ